ncbi:MAG TPA: hypothetical protein VM409_05140, partial [Chloroflexia bacterium]|nr:hypothetical protein [Chloroflexia bacterium]
MPGTQRRHATPPGSGVVGWTVRPFEKSDAPGVVALFNASWAADGIDSVFTELDLRMRLSAPKLDVSRHVIVADSPPAEGVPA